jgi:hypothetical protein
MTLLPIKAALKIQMLLLISQWIATKADLMRKLEPQKRPKNQTIKGDDREKLRNLKRASSFLRLRGIIQSHPPFFQSIGGIVSYLTKLMLRPI